MTKGLIVLWAYLVSWVCSALLHAVDADVGGVQGLWAPSVLLSVSVFALLVFIPVLLCRAAYCRGQWKGFFGAVVVFAVGMGFIVGLLGFGGTPSQSRFLGIAGMSALFGLVLVAASVPMLWVDGLAGRRQGVRTKE